MRIPPHAKYEIIYEMTKQDGNRLSVSTLCEIAGVSRSGYYNYLSTEDVRLKREEQDRKDFQKILEAYSFRGYNKGARSIYMRLLHMDPPIHMNVKKIRRLMKKYGLFCPIRKANPYRRMAKAMATNNIAPNLVNREFEKHGPRKILLTDITYIINGKAPRVYMSTIIDAYTKEILSWVLSDSLVLDFVLDTVTQLCYTHDISLTEETIMASTQSARQYKDATDLVYDSSKPFAYLIRRLTPLECERLQGFPDGWTDIPGASDSARYKALGNSVAIPCADYIMHGVAAALNGD